MTKLTLQDIVQRIPKAREVSDLLELLQQKREGQRPISCPTLLALYLVHDLYDPGSSDHANLIRITTNLETAAAELISLSKLIGHLG